MKLAIALLPALTLQLSAAPLSGVKTIGPSSADYPTITAAMASIRTESLSGPLILELQPGYHGGIETYPLVFNNLPTTAVNTIALRPQAGATGLRISSWDTTAATVDLNGARFVTIDGRPGGVGDARQLTIANHNPGGVAVRFINEASGNNLRHLVLEGANASATGGTVVFSTTTGANGNDNNTIDSCDLRDGGGTPANALYSAGSTGTMAQFNSGNTLSNCNIFNFYSANVIDVAGVRLETGNTDWTINGNSFYQTSARAAVGSMNKAANVRAIYVNNGGPFGVPSGNNFTIAGNHIGGDSPGAVVTTRKWTTTGNSAAYLFQGIRLKVGTTTASSVQGNVIRNMVWTGETSASRNIWNGIHIEEGDVDVGSGTGNIIGSGSGTGSIEVTTAGLNGFTVGIFSGSGGTVAINNNIIGSITTIGALRTNGMGLSSASLNGISVDAGVNTISNNTVGSTDTVGSLDASTPSKNNSGGDGQSVEGIVSVSTISATITGNTVANLNNNTLSFDSSSRIAGIQTFFGRNTITGNLVRNLSTQSRSAMGGTFSSVVGIAQSSSVKGHVVSGNVVHSLTNSSDASSVKVVGIYYQGNTDTGPNIIAGNLVHSLALVSTSGLSEISGMRIGGGTLTVHNNMVRVGIDADGNSTAGGATVKGIVDGQTTAGRSFLHNSVHVGGVQTSTMFGSYAFSGAGASDCRNNIFVNARSNNGATDKHYAIGYAGTTVNPAGLQSDHNLLFVSGAGGVLGRYNNGDRTTLAAWQAATGQDVSSAVADPHFVNPTGGASMVDLHLLAGNPAEGGGQPVPSVSDDFDGQTRGGLTPVDLGADAGDFTSSAGDIFAPSISYPPLTNGSISNRTLVGWAAIADNSGFVASGADSPRLYYKKATDADDFNVPNDSTGNGWKYATGVDGGNGRYSFTIDYTLLPGGTVSVRDIIEYFVVAQDAAGNLASQPAAATASAHPPVRNINGKPGAGVRSYKIVESMGGVVTVGGADGTYPSLTGAGGLFAALNEKVLEGNLTAKITGDIVETGGTGLDPRHLNHYPAPAFTVTIQPDSAMVRTVSGPAASGLIRLNGARGVTIDGSVGGSGRYLRFRNTSSSGATLVFINDACDNTVRNCVIEGASTSIAQGVVFFSTGLVKGNDDNTLSGNQIRNRSDAVGVPAKLVYIGGSVNITANNGTIANNELFNFTSHGIHVTTGGDSWSIMDNTVYQTTARSSTLTGIEANASGTSTIRGNTVRDLSTSSDSYGIHLREASGSGTVAGNRIWNLGTYRAYGIAVGPAAGQSVVVANNMVAIGSSGSTGSNHGLLEKGVAGSSALIAHNSVLLTGTGKISANTWAYLRTGSSNCIVKNNIFLNLRTGSDNRFAAGVAYPEAGSVVMDHNVYAGSGMSAAENFFDVGGVSSNFARWQAVLAGDARSSAGSPGAVYASAMFVDAANGDLHLVPGGNPLVNDAGAPVPEVMRDYDGLPRSHIAPEIGADELPVTFTDWSRTNDVVKDPRAVGANGLMNLLNFAFGLSPNDPVGKTLSYSNTILMPGGISAAPVSGIPSVMFIRRLDYGAVGLSYTAQFSADLVSWEVDPTTPTVLATDGAFQVVSLAYPLLADGARSRYFRLVVNLQ